MAGGLSRLVSIGLAVCTLSSMATPARAEEVPWRYPVEANLLVNRQGYLTVTNRERLLDKDFVPSNLVPLELPSVDGPALLRREAALALRDMFAAAEEAGYTLYVKSAYRSWQTQNTMYHNRLEKLGRDDGVVAYPGSSDHQTGLGVDILNREWTLKEGMKPAFGATAEAQWMEAHCHEFGFILRYMEEKQEATGIIYEPWHFRYVGKAAARQVMENRLTLEEFEAEYLREIQAYEASGGDFDALVKRLEAPPVPVRLKTADEGGDFEVSLFRQEP